MSKVLLLERAFLQSFLLSRHENHKKILDLISTDDVKKEGRDIFSAVGINKEDFSAKSISKKNGSVFEIDIIGLLTPVIDVYSAFYAEPQTLYSSIIDAIKIAENDNSIAEIQFNVDSPGGYVSGVDEAGNAIANTSKKTTALVSDLSASAGYWLSSQCDEIICKNAADEIGSIGVAVEIFDFSGYYDNFGIKHYSLTSENAENKRPDISTEEGRQQIIDRLNGTEKIFHSRVASGRNVSIEIVKEKYGRGGCLMAEDALSVGMIDSVINGLIVKPKSKTQNLTSANSTENKNLKTQENTMNELEKFLAENPAAKADYDKAIDSAVKLGEDKVNARVNTAKNYLSNENYPTLSELALQVALGEADAVALTASVAAIDAAGAKVESKEAKKETENSKETPAEQKETSKVEESGECTSASDVDAEIKRLKGDK